MPMIRKVRRVFFRLLGLLEDARERGRMSVPVHDDSAFGGSSMFISQRLRRISRWNIRDYNC